MFYRLSVILPDKTIEEIGEFRTNKRQALVYSKQLLRVAPIGIVRIERKRSLDGKYQPWIKRSFSSKKK